MSSTTSTNSNSNANMVAAGHRYDTLPKDITRWFNYYKLYATSIADAGGFLEHLEGTAKIPRVPKGMKKADRFKIRVDLQEKFRRAKAKAWEFLVQISRDHLSTLIQRHEATRNPEEAWKDICDHYEKNLEESSQAHLMERLRNLKFVDTGDFRDDLRKVTNEIVQISNTLEKLPAPDTFILPDSQKKMALEQALARHEKFRPVLIAADAYVRNDPSYETYQRVIEDQIIGIQKRSKFAPETAEESKSNNVKEEKAESKALEVHLDSDDLKVLGADYSNLKKTAYKVQKKMRQLKNADEYTKDISQKNGRSKFHSNDRKNPRYNNQHYQRNSRFNNQNYQKNSQHYFVPKKKVRCYICGKMGHLSITCIHRKNYRGPNQSNFQPNFRPQNSFQQENSVHAHLTSHQVTPNLSFPTSDRVTEIQNEPEIFVGVTQLIPEIHVPEFDFDKVPLALISGSMNQHFQMVIDSGATRPMCKQKSAFHNLRPDRTPVRLADGTLLYTAGIGSIGKFDNIYYVPKLKFNLLSVGYLNDQGYGVLFDSDRIVKLIDKNRLTTTLGHRENGLFYTTADFFGLNNQNDMYSLSAKNSLLDSNTIVHRRIMHINHDYLIHAIQNNLVKGLEINLSRSSFQFCEACAIAKTTRTPSTITPGSSHNIQRNYSRDRILNQPNSHDLDEQKSEEEEVTNVPESISIVYPFEKIVTDIKGPLPISIHRSKYILIFTCYLTRYRFVSFLMSKDQAEKEIRKMILEVRRLNYKVKVLKSDNAKEFISDSVNQLLLENGIFLQTTSPYTPHQNGVAERTNRSVIELTVASMWHAQIPIILWPYTVKTVINMLNYFPNKHLGMNTTPYIQVFNRIPDLSYLRNYGCDCYLVLPEHQRLSFGPRAVKAQLIGYDHPRSLSYLCYFNNKVYRTGHVQFNEQSTTPDISQDWSKSMNNLMNSWIDLDSDENNRKIEEITFNEKEIDSYNIPFSRIPTPKLARTWLPPLPAIPEETSSEKPVNKEIPSSQTQSSKDLQEPSLPSENSPLLSSSTENPIVDDLNTNSTKSPSDGINPDLPEKLEQSSETERKSKKARIDPLPTRTSSRLKAKYSDIKSIKISDAMNALLSGKYYDKKYENYHIRIQYDTQLNFLGRNNSIPKILKVDVLNNAPTLEEAKESENWKDWLKAIETELEKLKKLGTWEVVDKMPDDRRPIKHKWVLKMKLDMLNNLIFKARLTVKGFTQIFGVDFDETFAPVARFTSIRLILSIGIQLGWLFWQYDVESAFPNAELPPDIEIYLIPPEELNLPPGKFLRLKRALYGLKQASREWNLLISNFLISIGFTQLVSDSCIFKIYRNNSVLYLILYVDDMIVCGPSQENMIWLAEKLRSRFIIKQTVLNRCLGIETNYDRRRKILFISKNDYIKNLITKWNHLLTHIPYQEIPMDANLKLSRESCPQSEEEKELMKKFPYREIIGSLNYLSNSVRPDISFSVNYLARFMDNPGHEHWTHLLKLLAYLRDHPKSYITYGDLSNKMLPNTLYVFVDADYATSDLDSRRSVTGYLIFFNGGLISWKTQLQKSQSSSSTEAEYKAIHEAAKEAIWISNIINELSYPLSMPIVVYEDNESTINAIANPVQHSKLKHIDIVYHSIREWSHHDKIKIYHIPRENQLADVMNKPADSRTFNRFISQLLSFQH